MSTSDQVLVVDDDDDIREVLVVVLGMRSIPAVGVRDGQEALEWMRGHGDPALILLDLRMPRMSGIDFARELKHDPAHASIPIVVLSGDAAALESAEHIGALGCVPKPIDLDALIDLVLRGIDQAVETGPILR